MSKVHVWRQREIEWPTFWDTFFPCFTEKNYEAICDVFDDNWLLTSKWSDGFEKFEEKIKKVRDGVVEEDFWDGNYFIATINKDNVFFHTCFPEEDEDGFELGIEETLTLIQECKEINYVGNETRACKRKKADEVKIIVASFDELGEIHKDYVFTEPLIITKENYVVGQNLRLEDALYLKLGETRKLKLNPFGNHVSESVKDVDLAELPKGLELKVGAKVALAVPYVGNTLGKVLEVNEKTAKVDFNHPRAGELVYCTVTRIG